MDPLEYIVKDGMMECDKGSSPEKFKPTFNTKTKIEDILAATVEDAKPIKNIPSFKICKVDHKPCTPVTSKSDWEKSFDFKINGEKTLLGESFLKCKKGGKIKFITSGQVPVDKSKGEKKKGGGKNEENKKEKDSIGESGFVEGMIPVWGSGRDAVDSFQKGEWGWGVFNSAMVVVDVCTLGAGSIVKGGIKGGLKSLFKGGAKKALSGLWKGTKKLAKKAKSALGIAKDTTKAAVKKLKKPVLAIKNAKNKVKNKAKDGYKKAKDWAKKVFDPVDPITGHVFYPYTDFELSGPLPFVWKREYNSGSSFTGLLGYGVSSPFDVRITESFYEDKIKINLAEGDTLAISIPEEGKSIYHIIAKLEIFKVGNTYKIFDYKTRLWYYYSEIKKQVYVPVKIEDERGFTNQFSYEGSRLIQIIDSRGHILKVDTDSRGYITRISYPTSVENRILVEYEYDETGNMVAAYDSYKQKTIMEYDSHHRMIKKTDRNGQSFYWEYDSVGRCIHTWGDGGLQEGFLEYKLGKTIVADPTGFLEIIEYDQKYNITRETDAYGNFKSYEYNEDGFLIKETDEEGLETLHEYDDLGNRIKSMLPDGAVSIFVYDEENRLIQSKDPAGNKNHWIFKDNRLLKTVSNEESTVFFYNEKNLITKIRDFRNEETLFEYDKNCNLVEAVFSDGRTSHWEYNAFGDCIRVVDPMGKAQQFEYDRLGRVIKVHLPNSDKMDLKYDAYDSVLQVNSLRSKINYTYTPLGSMLSREERGVKVNFEYDKQERLMGLANEKGEQYQFFRNRRGDIIQEVSFDGMNKYYQRDKAGKVVKVSRPGGHTLYEYDRGGRIVRAEYQDESWETFSYDSGGRLTEARNLHSLVRFKRNPLGQVIQEQQGEHLIDYTYDAKGDLQQLNSSLGAEVKYERDKYGLIEQIQAGEKSPWTAQIKRNMLGLEIERTLPGGVKSSWSYDENNNLVSQKVENIKLRTCLHKNYQWNANQQLQQIMNELTKGTTVFSYDVFGSLASAKYEDGSFDYKMPDEIGNLFNSDNRTDRKYGAGGKLIQDKKWDYHYDPQGNLILKTKRKIGTISGENFEKTESKAGKFSFWIDDRKPKVNYANSYDQKAEIRKYSKKELKEYDRLRETQKQKEEARFLWQPGDWYYQWYASGMLKSVTDPEGRKISFEYDTLGRRTAKIAGDVIYRYLWDGNVLLHEWKYKIEERPKLLTNSKGMVYYSGYEPIKELLTWVYEDGSFVPSAKITEQGNYSLISDYIGRPVQAYNEEGELVWEAEYSIYGEVKIQKGDKNFIPFRQLGQYEDQELGGLFYNRFRYYNPETGSYISKDPIGLAGNNPNLYAYVHDSNIQIDPFGLETSFKAAFRQAKSNLGIPKNINTPKPVKVFDAQYENRTVWAFSGEHEGKFIVMHGEDKFGRGNHLHTATLIDESGNLHQSPLEKGRYNQHAGHIPEDVKGFKGKPKGCP